VKRRELFSIQKLLLLWVGAASGCAAPYVPPNLPREQVATVSGVDMIDRRIVNRSGLQTSTTTVLPGVHTLGFGGGSQSLFTTLLLRSNQQYAFSTETYLIGSRLKMRNITTGKVSYLDLYHMVYYDESGTPLPPDNPFAP
jgi:hypothetical protein